MTSSDVNAKVFKDPIHGSISLPMYCVAVIDTPEFQRLRNIKQLTAETVYPGATHTRFAHSIGVCYLAGKVIEHLKANQPELKITDDEVKCVQLAGLCHDLGHGPLSHKFESVVNRLLPEDEKWEHEEASVDMLHYLKDQNNIKLKQDEVDFIGDLISGKPPKEEGERAKRFQNRRFLFQIVANKDNGIDVDKWDYFARDCHYLGVANSFDHQRIIPFMRVCVCKRDGKETREICYRDKLLRDLSSMFAVRWDLHDRAYQHRVVKLAEQMFADALHIYFTEDAKKENPEFGPIGEVIKDMSIYSLLDDHIVGAITRSKGEELEKARNIIKRIKKRDMYPRIGEILNADSQNIPSDAVLKSNLIDNRSLQQYCSEDNLLVITHKYDYGMKDKNPLKYIFFYTKDDDNKGILLGDEKMPPTLPAKIQLRDVRLYTRAPIPEGSRDVILQSLRTGVEQAIMSVANQVTPAKGTHSADPGRPRKSKGSRDHDLQDGGPSKIRKTGDAMFDSEDGSS